MKENKMEDKQDFGVVEYKGKTLSLTQYPYINYHNTKDYYISHAVDDEENEYMVYWNIINDNAEDESDCCDWENYEVAQI